MTDKETYHNSRAGSGHLDENELAQYADFLRLGTGQPPDSLMDHVAACSFCRDELMAITDLLDTLPDLAEEPSFEYHKPENRILRRTSPVFHILRTAAAVAAVVFIAWGIKTIFPNRPVNEPLATTSPNDSTPPNDSLTPNLLTPNLLTSSQTSSETPPTPSSLPDTLVYASAFVPDPVFENLVNAKYRTGADPGVTGPDSGAVFRSGDTLKISWKPDPGDTYVFILLDNKANSVKEIKISGAGLLNWKIDLKPGLYYWKFMGKEDLWKVGKIKIIGS